MSSEFGDCMDDAYDKIEELREEFAQARSEVERLRGLLRRAWEWTNGVVIYDESLRRDIEEALRG